MKKIYYILFVLIFTCSLFTACEKDKDDSGTGALTTNDNDTNDTTPPAIVIAGSNPIIVSLNSSYTDPGAVATDDNDGNVSVTNNVSSTNPDVNLAGTYLITYSAIDSAGNQSSAIRTVIVRNDSYYLEGTYETTEMSSAWIQTITASITVNNRIHFSKFANFLNNSSIYANVIGNQVDFPIQTAVNIGFSGCDHTFTPNGTGNPISVSPTITFSIKYTDQQLVGGAGCPGTGAVPYESLFVKQ